MTKLPETKTKVWVAVQGGDEKLPSFIIMLVYRL